MNLRVLKENIPQIADYIEIHYDFIRKKIRPYFISLKALEHQVLLYLPRLFKGGEAPSVEKFKNEIDRVCSILVEKIIPYKELSYPPSSPILSLKEIEFSRIDISLAKIIQERFHYIGSFRNEGIHFGLIHEKENRILSLITLSPFDLNHIIPIIPSGISDSEIMVVSRIFAFDYAPRNSISYMFKRVYSYFKEGNRKIKMLLTYVNPNMGFTGSSYKASGWMPFAKELGTRYSYIDEKYVTDRELVKSFGTSDPLELMKKKSIHFEVTEIGLAPLLIFHFFLDNELRRKEFSDYDQKIMRPK